jgi:hypothetical protein
VPACWGCAARVALPRDRASASRRRASCALPGSRRSQAQVYLVLCRVRVSVARCWSAREGSARVGDDQVQQLLAFALPHCSYRQVAQAADSSGAHMACAAPAADACASGGPVLLVKVYKSTSLKVSPRDFRRVLRPAENSNESFRNFQEFSQNFRNLRNPGLG